MRNRKEKIKKNLDKKLGAEFLSVRQGCGGVKLTYVEGWVIISLANRIFGFDGWNSEVKDLKQEYLDVSKEDKIFVGYTCLCRITVSDGTFKEDVGFGSAENQRMKGLAIEKAKKEAVTDSFKRAFRQFGNALGNWCYDKIFLKQVSKVNTFNKNQPIGEDQLFF